MTDFPHTATIPTTTDDGVEIVKEYRWRVEMFDGRPRVVGEHRLFAGQLDGRWSPLRNPDRMAQLLARTPACKDCGEHPATACPHCGVVLCADCGEGHTVPDCPPQLEAYHRDLARMAAAEPCEICGAPKGKHSSGAPLRRACEVVREPQ